MSARINLAIVAVAAAFGIGGFVASRYLFGPGPPAAAPAIDTVAVGERYRDVALPDLAGRTRRLSEWDGQVRLVNFWATWCVPCLREMPLLDRYARQHPEVAVLGIAFDGAEPAAKFVETLGIAYPILVDQPSPADSSAIHGNRRGVLPFSVLIDTNGVVRAAEAGDFEDLAELESFLLRSNAR